MTRRTAIVTVLSMPLGYFRAFAAERGWLTIDLAVWKGIEITLAGKTQHITAAQIFAALEGK